MNSPFLIVITGGSGSGKTSFVEKLLESLPKASLVSMDNYYKDRSLQPKDTKGIENFDLPESLDLDRFKNDVDKLLKGHAVELKEYNYNNSDSSEKMICIEPSELLIIEGMFALNLEYIKNICDLTLFIDAPPHLMLKRRIKRDAEERGYDLNDVLYRFENHVMPSFEKFIVPSRNIADLVVPNHTSYQKALSIVVAFLNQLNH